MGVAAVAARNADAVDRDHAAGAVAAHFPGFVRWAYAAEHPSAEPAPIRPTAYTPQFFASEDYPVIARLVELIIPSDETPGAREAGVAEFVDFMVAHDQEQQQAMRTGLAWFHAHVERAFGQPFLALTEPQQGSPTDRSIARERRQDVNSSAAFAS